MKPDSHAVFESPNELGVGRCRRRGQMAGPDFAVDRQKAAEGKLKSASVTPGADGVSEDRRLRAALETNSAKAIWHEAFAESGIDGSEHKIGIGRPDQI